MPHPVVSVLVFAKSQVHEAVVCGGVLWPHLGISAVVESLFGRFDLVQHLVHCGARLLSELVCHL